MTRFTGFSEAGVKCASATDLVWNRVRAELRHVDSPLLDNGEVEQELVSTIRTIIESTMSHLSGVSGRQSAWPIPDSRHLSADHVGTERARQRIHPAISLAAADILFKIALPILVTYAADLGRTAPGAEQVAVALHEAINAIVTPASVDYVDVLLDRLSVAHSEERRQVSRDLHDRVAQSIAAAAQRLTMITRWAELSDDTNAAGQPGTDTTPDSPDAAALARAALDLVNEGLAETRAIATELRQSVGDRMLYEALAGWAKGLVGEPSCVITETGVAGRLAPSAREEAFMIVREFIRNARRHSGAANIDVQIDWFSTCAEFAVVDDGRGFRTDEIRSGAMGLVAARERSEIIGGSIRIESELGAGSRAVLTVPVRAA